MKKQRNIKGAPRDPITGLKLGFNPLNKKKLRPEELDEWALGGEVEDDD
jgi:hypothetical protein